MEYLNGWYCPPSKLLGFEISPTPDQLDLWLSDKVIKLTWSSLVNVSQLVGKLWVYVMLGWCRLNKELWTCFVCNGKTHLRGFCPLFMFQKARVDLARWLDFLEQNEARSTCPAQTTTFLSRPFNTKNCLNCHGDLPSIQSHKIHARC